MPQPWRRSGDVLCNVKAMELQRVMGLDSWRYIYTFVLSNQIVAMAPHLLIWTCLFM